MIVSVRLIVLFSILNASRSLTTNTDSHGDGISGKHVQAFLHGNRIKRAFVSKAVQSALKVGTEAVKKLLNNARFVYSNGLDSVFVKTGGIKKALEDFDSVVDPKKVRNLPTKSKDKINRVGKIGDLTIAVNNESGSVVLKISKRWYRLTASANPASVDSIIVYKGN